MRGAGLKIGRILGIPIYLHSSWFLIFALITYSLGANFGSINPEWTAAQHWSLGLLTSLLFFGSVLFHELSHSAVAKHYRIPVASITLFFFGGIARISRDPERAGQEFLIAAAGPASSYVLAAGFWLLAISTPDRTTLNALGTWLAVTNGGLATFNLLPGFPLDGGRILRSIVWGITKDYSRSTRIAARTGQAIACGMIALGLWIAFLARSGGNNMLNGIWLVFIGWFLLSAARQSYAQVATRGALEGLRVADIMSAEMPTVGRDMSLEEYAREAARTGRRAHLVVSDGQFLGLMRVEALQGVPREEWPVTSVQAAMLSRDKLPWTGPEESVLDLLDRMRATDVDQIAVVTDGNLVGVVTRDSIARVVQTRTDLGQLTSR
jgi:Zn-dependent protease/predicted transcriptional regulator